MNRSGIVGTASAWKLQAASPEVSRACLHAWEWICLKGSPPGSTFEIFACWCLIDPKWLARIRISFKKHHKGWKSARLFGFLQNPADNIDT